MSLSRLARNDDIAFHYSIDSTACVMIDHARIVRAITNIIENALDALTGQKGTVQISAKKISDEKLQLSITNNGPMISETVREHIFDAFFTRGKKGGTGLGLAISKKNIELHDGTICCESSQNNGTTFSLVLPSAAPHDLTLSSEKLPSTSFEMVTEILNRQSGTQSMDNLSIPATSTYPIEGDDKYLLNLICQQMHKVM